MFIGNVPQNLSQEEAAFATLLANHDGYKRVLPPGATPTITQSGLLPVLFERQRYKFIRKARHAHRWKPGVALWRRFERLLPLRIAQTVINDSRRGSMQSVPAHT